MACFLCNNQNVKEHSDLTINCYFYDCPNCGKYGIEDFVRRDALNPSDREGNSFEEFRNKAACVAAERKTKGMDKFLLVTDSNEKAWGGDSCGVHSPIGIKNFLKDYPQDAVEMFDRILLTLGRLIKHPAESLLFSDLVDPYHAIFYCTTDEQLRNMVEELKNQGWIKTRNSYETIVDEIRITPHGWQRIAELRKARAFEYSDKVFLAMWFDDKTKKLREAVKEAVRQAGYSPEEIAVDEAEHNDFIMDKVKNMITEARFVIADFTCGQEGTLADGKIPGGVRGGVYFEAGFARGQGKEVIHTCQDSDEARSRLHFDVHQTNTIFWKKENGSLTSYGDDFIDILKNRIIVTVGKGKHL